MGPRRRPTVYLDACCFGVVAQKTPRVDAIAALITLLEAIDADEFDFVSSGWLLYELGEIQPDSRRRRAMSFVPDPDEYVPWTNAIGREATKLVLRIGLEGDDSGERDCRHLACAISARADFLVTMDGQFFEAMRQHVRLIAPVRPTLLIGWRELIYEE